MSLCGPCRTFLKQRLYTKIWDLSIQAGRSSSLRRLAHARSYAATASAEHGQKRKPVIARYSRESPPSIELVVSAEISDKEKSALSKEVAFLKDPHKLNNRVRRYLLDDNLFKALNMLRLASFGTKCEVGWNLVIDYIASKRQFTMAWKVYNEMKKRGQKPSSYTITALLRHLAKPPVTKQQFDMGIKIYKSVTSENSKIPPSTMVANCALQMCMQAGEWDTSWEMIGDLPEDGPGAPSIATYDTMLNLLRRRVTSMGRSDELYGKTLDRAIDDAAVVFEELEKKSAKSRLPIDIRTLCTYMKLLSLRPSDEDAIHVLSLVEKHRKIPMILESSAGAANVQAARSSEDDTRVGKTDIKADKVLLSIILKARQGMIRPPPGLRTSFSYWDVLTTQHGIKPDLENFHWYLRACLYNSSSERALVAVHELLLLSKARRNPEIIPAPGFQEASSALEPNRTTWYLAMAACANTAEKDYFKNVRPEPPRTSIAMELNLNDPALLTDMDRSNWNESLGAALANPRLDWNRVTTSYHHATRLCDAMVTNSKELQSVPVRVYLSVALATMAPAVIYLTLLRIRPLMDRIHDSVSRPAPRHRYILHSHGDEERLTEKEEWDFWALCRVTFDTIGVLSSPSGREKIGLVKSGNGSIPQNDFAELRNWAAEKETWLAERVEHLARTSKGDIESYATRIGGLASGPERDPTMMQEGKVARRKRREQSVDTVIEGGIYKLPAEAWRHQATEDIKSINRLKKLLGLRQ